MAFSTCPLVQRLMIPKAVLLPVKGPAVGMDWAGNGVKAPPKAGAGGTAGGLAPKAPTIYTIRLQFRHIECKFIPRTM